VTVCANNVIKSWLIKADPTHLFKFIPYDFGCQLAFVGHRSHVDAVGTSGRGVAGVRRRVFFTCSKPTSRSLLLHGWASIERASVDIQLHGILTIPTLLSYLWRYVLFTWSEARGYFSAVFNAVLPPMSHLWNYVHLVAWRSGNALCPD